MYTSQLIDIKIGLVIANLYEIVCFYLTIVGSALVVNHSTQNIESGKVTKPGQNPCSRAQLKKSRMGMSFHAKVGACKFKDRLKYIEKREKRHEIGISPVNLSLLSFGSSTYVICLYRRRS